MADLLTAAAGFGVLGLVMGSFLSVVIHRQGTGETILWGRSHCHACRKPLRWFELVPLASFFMQGGRCRSCKKAIGWFYPAVEVITAIIFAGIGVLYWYGSLPLPPFALGPGGPGQMFFESQIVWALYYALFAVLAIAISWHDALHQVIPSRPMRLLLLLGIASVFAGVLRGGRDQIFPLLAPAAAAFLFFWSLWYFSKGRAMGRGDADAALGIALVLGPRLGPAGFLFAFWLGAIFGIMVLVMRRMRWQSRMALAPFLFAGAFMSFFFLDYFASFLPFLYVLAPGF